MARKVQRNEPCPCGSGKKYKKCCMIKERGRIVAGMNRKEGVQHALAWVSNHYRDQIDRWVDEVWLADISEQQRKGIASADAKIRSIHDINLLEQLVAEGHFADEEGENRPLQLILDSDEVGLNDEQRDYLIQLSDCPLRLYAITACVAGESFSIRDQMDARTRSIEINDPYASRMFEVGDVAGFRLLKTSAGWETSGAIYYIPDAYAPELEAQLKQTDKDARSTVLTRRWLELVAAHV